MKKMQQTGRGQKSNKQSKGGGRAQFRGDRPRGEGKPQYGEKKDRSGRARGFRGEEREEKPRYDDVVCGRNAVLEAIKSGRQVNKVLLAENTDPAFSASVFRLCKEHNIPCHQLPKQKLANYAGPEHHGIAAEIAAVTYVEISDILANAAAKNEPPFVILLDGVEDPHNLGAVIRTALCAGAHGVVVPRNRAVAVNQTVMKTSAGGASYLPIARVPNISQAIRELQAAGCWVVAADMDGKPMWELDLTGPIAIVMGAEGDGVSPLVKKNCDFIASIPMQGPLDSLNISNAAAVLMYEAVRQKRMK